MSIEKRSVVEQTLALKAEVVSIVDSANVGRKSLHQVSLSSALKVLVRSLDASRGVDVEVRCFSALRDVEQFVLLYQENKVVGNSLANADLLPVAHPSSVRVSGLSASALVHARLRWFVEEDDELLGLVASASLVDVDSAEFKYVASRVSAAGYADLVLDALTAAFGQNTGGNSYWARRMRALAQRRDSKGRFAYQGGGSRVRVRNADGSVSWYTGRVVGASADGAKIDIELSDGRIARVPIEKTEGVEAVLDFGKSSIISPTVEEEALVVDEKDVEFVDAPSGWQAWGEPSVDESGREVAVFRHESGEFSVARLKNSDGSVEFSVLDERDGANRQQLGKTKNWTGVSKLLGKNVSQEEKDSVKANITGEVSEPLSPEDIADLFDAQDGLDDGDDIIEVAPAAPKKPVSKVPPRAYELDLANFVPSGKDGGESSNYTDDPVELAKRFSQSQLATALRDALVPPAGSDEGVFASGSGFLPFSDADEPVPAEALYKALKDGLKKNAGAFVDAVYKKFAEDNGYDWEPPVVPAPVAPPSEPTTTPEPPAEPDAPARKMVSVAAKDIKVGDRLDPAGKVRVTNVRNTNGKVFVAHKLKGSKSPGADAYDPEEQVKVWREIEPEVESFVKPADAPDAIEKPVATPPSVEEEVKEEAPSAPVEEPEVVPPPAEPEAPKTLETISPKSSKEMGSLVPGDVVDFGEMRDDKYPEGKFEVVEVYGEPTYTSGEEEVGIPTGWGNVEITLRPVDATAEKNAKDLGWMDDSLDTMTLDWNGNDNDGFYPDFNFYGSRGDLVDEGLIDPDFKPFVESKVEAEVSREIVELTPDTQSMDDVIQDAIANNKLLMFAYNGSVRVLTPTELKTSKDGNKLVVTTDDAGNVKSFRLDKLENLEDVITPSVEDEIAVAEALGGSELTPDEVKQIVDAENVDVDDPELEAKVVDIDSSTADVESVVAEAIANGDFLRFNYNGKNRVLKPSEIKVSGFGNLNVLGIDAEGNEKNFTVSKMSPFVDEPEVLPVAEPVGKPRKAKVKVSDLQPGDVLVNDFFVVESVFSDDESEKSKPGSVWVTGYYPGHESQKTKLWYPEDTREVFRDVEVPVKGDKPALSKPKFKDFGKFYKDKQTGEWMFTDPANQAKFDAAMDEYNAQLVEAMGSWSAPEDFVEIDLSQDVAPKVVKTVVKPSDLKPGDISYQTDTPPSGSGSPYKSYFVIEEIVEPTDEEIAKSPSLAGKVAVVGHFPGHKSQRKFWNPNTPITIIRGEGNLPASGDGEEIHRPFSKDAKYKRADGTTDTELYKEDLKKYHEMKSQASALYTPAVDAAGEYGASPASVPVAPKKPGRAPSAPAFQGAYLTELLRQAGGDPAKLKELLGSEIVTFFDFETTGQNPNFGADSRPIQIAAYKMNVATGEIVDQFVAFMNPGESLGSFYYKKDGNKNLILDENGNKILDTPIKNDDGEMISDEFLASQPSVEEKMAEFFEWLGADSILAGQNAAGFDEPILRFIANNIGVDYGYKGLIDTLSLANAVIEPGKKVGRTLGDLTKRYDVKLDGWHDARADSLAVHGVLNGLLDEMIETGVFGDELDPDARLATYEAALEKFDAKVKAYKDYQDALNAQLIANALADESKTPSLDELVENVSGGVPVPDPNGVFNDPVMIENPPGNLGDVSADGKNVAWVLDDANTTLIDGKIRPDDFEVGDFFPTFDNSTFHEITDITVDPADDNMLIVSTKIVNSDKTYEKKYFRYNKSFEGVRRPNGKGDFVPSDAPDSAEVVESVDGATVDIDAPKKALSDVADGLSTPIDISGWKKVGGQYGANAGGVYEDENGTRFYVKQPKSEEHGKSEVLASALYDLAGVKVGRSYLGKDADGNLLVVSPWVDGSKNNFGDVYDNPAVKKAVQADFAVDAWLMNWDAVGLNFDNMVTVGDDVFRIDAGGALLFRAQGAKKDDSFLVSDVSEIDSMRNQSTASKVFGDMSDEDVLESIKKLEEVSPEQISEVVDKVFADDPALANQLKELLVARRQNLLDRLTPPSQPSAVAEGVEVFDGTGTSPDSVGQPVADAPEGVADFTKDNSDKDAYGEAAEIYAYDDDELDYEQQQQGAMFNPANYDSTSELVDNIDDYLDLNYPDKFIAVYNSETDVITFKSKKFPNVEVTAVIQEESMSGDMVFEVSIVGNNPADEFADEQSVGTFSSVDDMVSAVESKLMEAEVAHEEYVGSAPHQRYDVETSVAEDIAKEIVSGDGSALPSLEEIIESIEQDNISKSKITDPNLIVKELLEKYPDAYVNENGHLVVRSFTQNNPKDGKDYRAEVVVVRNLDETFTVYSVLTDLSTGEKRFALYKSGNRRQSAFALQTKIQEMSLRSFQVNFVDAFNAMAKNGNVNSSLSDFGFYPNNQVDISIDDVPSSVAEDIDNNIEFLSDVVLPKTGDIMKDALLGLVENMSKAEGISQKFLDALYDLPGIKKEIVDDVVRIVKENALKKFPVSPTFPANELPDKPHVSADGKTAVKLGDRVLYVKGGKYRVGTVSDMTEAQLTQMPDGTYAYSDYTLVDFNTGGKPIKRSARYLQILSEDEYQKLLSGEYAVPAPTYVPVYKGGKGVNTDLISKIGPDSDEPPSPPSPPSDEPEPPSTPPTPSSEGDSDFALPTVVVAPANYAVSESELAEGIIESGDGKGILVNQNAVLAAVLSVYPVSQSLKDVERFDFIPIFLGNEDNIVYGQVSVVKNLPNNITNVSLVYFDSDSGVYKTVGLSSASSAKVKSYKPTESLKSFADKYKDKKIDSSDSPASVDDVADFIGSVNDSVEGEPYDTGKVSEIIDGIKSDELDSYGFMGGLELTPELFAENPKDWKVVPLTLQQIQIGDVLTTKMKDKRSFIITEIKFDEDVKSNYSDDYVTFVGYRIDPVTGEKVLTELSYSKDSWKSNAVLKNYNHVSRHKGRLSVDPEQYYIKEVSYKDASSKTKFENIKKASIGQLQVGDLVPVDKGKFRHYRQIVAIHKFATRTNAGVSYSTYYSYRNIYQDASNPSHGQYGLSTSNIYLTNVKRPTTSFADTYLAPKFDAGVPVYSIDKSDGEFNGVKVFNTVDDLKEFGGYDKKSYNFLHGFLAKDYEEFKKALKQTDFVVKDGSSDKRYILPGMVVRIKETNSYAIVSEVIPKGGVRITHVTGQKAGSIETVNSDVLESEGHVFDAETASKLGVFVDTEPQKAIKSIIIANNKEAEAQAKALKEQKDKEAAEKKKQAEWLKTNYPSGSGAEPVVVETPLSLDSSDFEGVYSPKEALDVARTVVENRREGVVIPLDADSIEDAKVRIQSVLDETGQKKTRVSFKLTDWAGKKYFDVLSKLNSENSDDVSFSDKLEVTRWKQVPVEGEQDVILQDSGQFFTDVSASGEYDVYIGGYQKGLTIRRIVRDSDGNVLGVIKFLKATKNNSDVNWNNTSTSTGNPAIGFNHTVDIMLNDGVTIEQVMDALGDAGVANPRPATKADIRVIAENRLLTIFSTKPTDATKNASGVARKETLDSIKETYGITADMVEVVPRGNGLDFELLLPREIGVQLAKKAGIKYFYHAFKGSGDSNLTYAQRIFDRLRQTGMKGTTERWMNGMNVAGMSSANDITLAGGQSVYMHVEMGEYDENQNHVYGSNAVFFDPAELLRRLDYYSNDHDSYGHKAPNTNYFEKLKLYQNEVMFKGIAFWASAYGIAIDNKATAQEIYQLFVAKGISQIDGVPLIKLLGL